MPNKKFGTRRRQIWPCFEEIVPEIAETYRAYVCQIGLFTLSELSDILCFTRYVLEQLSLGLYGYAPRVPHTYEAQFFPPVGNCDFRQRGELTSYSGGLQFEVI